MQDKIKLPKILGKQAGLIGLSVLALWLVRDRLGSVDLHTTLSVFKEFSAGQWALAAAFTGISLSAVAQYDRLMAGHMGLNLPAKLARFGGWRAAAISQVLGLGLLSGALVRWRLYGQTAGVSLWQSTKLTGAVGITFVAASFVVCAVAALLSGSLHMGPVWLPLALIAGTGLALVLSLRGVSFGQFSLPNFRTLLSALVYSTIDMTMAAAVIYIFIPDGYVTFLMFLPIFILAFNLGLISSLPGGVGPFEALLIASLPAGPVEPLLAAILAYRFIYFAVPALLAVPALIRPPVAEARITELRSAVPAGPVPPEAGLVGLEALRLRRDNQGVPSALEAETTNTGIVFRDPFGVEQPDAMLSQWTAQNRAALRGSCLYKTGTGTARIAKELGFHVLPLAKEALIAPYEFSLTGRDKRQLRRKLNQAKGARVEVRNSGLPTEFAAQIDLDWVKRTGGARGFSMGRFSPDLLAWERVYSAWVEDKPVAFVSFMTGHAMWTLDLIRTSDSCPPGATHALITAALADAKNLQIETVSLSSVPFAPDIDPEYGGHRLWRAVAGKIFARRRDLQGLAQFKQSFAPQWRTEYLCFDTVLSGGIAAVDLWRLIHRPCASTSIDTNKPHNHYALYEFAS